MTTTSTRYIPVADCAKLIRSDLKTTFPDIKFSVRSKSYSGGGHVSVSWTDGPTSNAVDAVCAKYEGASFDGMEDLKSYHDGELNGEVVHFGNNWTHCNRTISVELLTAVARAYCQRYNHPMPLIGVSGDSAYILDHDYTNPQDYRMHIQRKVEATDAERLDTLFEEEDRQIAEYNAWKAEQEAVQPEETPVVEEPVQDEPTTQYCMDCGHEIGHDDLHPMSDDQAWYCTRCGDKRQQVEAQPSTPEQPTIYLTRDNTPGCYAHDAQGNPWATFTTFNATVPCVQCGQEISGGWSRGKLGEETHFCVEHIETDCWECPSTISSEQNAYREGYESGASTHTRTKVGYVHDLAMQSGYRQGSPEYMRFIEGYAVGYSQVKSGHEQKEYTLVKSWYDALNKRAAALLGECTAETDEEIDAYCEREAEVHTSLGTLQAARDLRDAEEALLCWGHKVAKSDRRYKKHQADLEKLFGTRNVAFRERVIDLCLKLDV